LEVPFKEGLGIAEDGEDFLCIHFVLGDMIR